MSPQTTQREAGLSRYTADTKYPLSAIKGFTNSCRSTFNKEEKNYRVSGNTCKGDRSQSVFRGPLLGG